MTVRSHRKINDSFNLAQKARIDIIKMINNGGSAHVGSALSIVDLLSVIYSHWIPNKSAAKNHKFILSKGHAGAALYAILGNLGFFPKSQLMSHCINGSIFSGHVSSKVPGVEFSTGSLGQGLPVTAGMALAAKISNKKNQKFIVLLSDGELGEGSNWEAMLFAVHHKLDNLTIIIDRNKLQSMTTTENTLKLEPLNQKFLAFGLDVIEIDGHSHDDIYDSVNKAVTVDMPRVIIAHTTKGKGVSFMENSVDWHYKTPKDRFYQQALAELEGSVK